MVNLLSIHNNIERSTDNDNPISQLGRQPLPKSAMGEQMPPASLPSRAQHPIYWVVVLLVCIYSAVAYRFWHQTEQRMTVLENKILAMHSEISAYQHDASPESTPTEIGGPNYGQLIETEFLRLEFSAQHAQIVQSIAASSNEKYRQFYMDFGLGPPSSVHKRRIIVVSKNPTKVEDGTWVIHVTATSAKAYGLSEEEMLTKKLAIEMSQKLLTEALASRTIKPGWRAMIRSLQYYLIRENGFYPEWRPQPYYIWRRQLAQSQAINLSIQPESEPTPNYTGGQNLEPISDGVADTLIEFILTEYGTSYVPPLLDGFAQHEAWETLAPAVFGKPVDEFEEQWHAFLRQHYPIR